VVSSQPTAAFWRARRVVVTGHTGFKGAWLCRMLHALGAEVSGIALAPAEGPSAFAALKVPAILATDERLDIRDAGAVATALRTLQPEVVLHLAAQAIVAEGYGDPAGTFATNLGGTVNLLQALRGSPGVVAALIVTSDKVYRNASQGRPFTEHDPLGGTDPYSASKAAAELAVASWRASFAQDLPPMATARAGNVIGGGDFRPDRLVPDLIRAIAAGQPLVLRRPDATRPFQHVLDVLRGYLLLAERLATNAAAAPPACNFGPCDGELRVRDLLDQWGTATGAPVVWQQAGGAVIAEASRLALDSGLAEHSLGWRPRLSTPQAVAETAAWYAAWQRGEELVAPSETAIHTALAAEQESGAP
jgi:CDP-glucose 4,6-dehydratase